jgi:hypothetical protein
VRPLGALRWVSAFFNLLLVRCVTLCLALVFVLAYRNDADSLLIAIIGKNHKKPLN